jgi:FkbM family methyltransferase
MTALDVGAHAGYYTLLFSRLVGARGRVFAFEPHPATFAVLARNAERRHLSNVRLLPMAVADHEGEADLWQTSLSVGHSLLGAKPGGHAPLPVAVTSLDAWSRREAIDRADLVKVDVEGGETEVLAGMAELARRSPGLAVILEYKPEILRARGDDLPAFLGRLAAHGFADVAALSDAAPPRRLDPADASLRDWSKCNLLARRA